MRNVYSMYHIPAAIVVLVISTSISLVFLELVELVVNGKVLQ